MKRINKSIIFTLLFISSESYNISAMNVTSENLQAKLLIASCLVTATLLLSKTKYIKIDKKIFIGIIILVSLIIFLEKEQLIRLSANFLPILIPCVLLYYTAIKTTEATTDTIGQHEGILYTPLQIKEKFANIAGLKKAKDELRDILSILKNPKKYKKLDVKLPKGILLSGDPGNGKTLLARALCGEANCNFISINGSAFEQSFHGQGSMKVRSTFKWARENSPCILFIDEFDSIGIKRHNNMDEELIQTLNQLLCEMDGFDVFDDKQVLVLASTNIPDQLDKAIIRSGRFDIMIHIPYPNFRGRIETLKIHSKQKPRSNSVNDLFFEELANKTIGCSGADLANLVNCAAINAAREDKDQIGSKEFNDAAYKIVNRIDVIERIKNKKNIEEPIELDLDLT